MSPADGSAAVARLTEVDAGYPLAVTLPDGSAVCLVRHGDAVYAVEDRCPHRDFPLSGGDVVAPGVLECPWHGARFDVRTGGCLAGPATDAIATWPVTVVDGRVYLGARRAPAEEAP
jgi:3-phenylpropionate/trans-cinnamate dioxygenase ferredoxin subunit